MNHVFGRSDPKLIDIDEGNMIGLTKN